MLWCSEILGLLISQCNNLLEDSVFLLQGARNIQRDHQDVGRGMRSWKKLEKKMVASKAGNLRFKKQLKGKIQFFSPASNKKIDIQRREKRSKKLSRMRFRKTRLIQEHYLDHWKIHYWLKQPLKSWCESISGTPISQNVVMAGLCWHSVRISAGFFLRSGQFPPNYRSTWVMAFRD